MSEHTTWGRGVAGSRRRWVFACAVILTGAAALRLIALDRFPLPINQDELSNLYDGWSIAELGTDRHGEPLPFVLHGFGGTDYRPAMFAWLYAPIARWWGLSTPAGRAVSAVCGVASLALAGWWAWRAAGPRAAALLLLIAGVTPWHLLYSRMAHEGSMLPALGAASAIALVRWAAARTAAGDPRPWTWGVVGANIGLFANAYAATRLTSALFLLLAVVVHWRVARGIPIRRRLASVGWMIGLAAVMASPQWWTMIDRPEAFFGRARSEFVHASGPVGIAWATLRGYAANLDPRFLFDGLGTVNNLSVGRCLTACAPFFYLGILVLVVHRRAAWWVDRALLLGGLFISILPSAITRDSPHALRASGMAMVAPMITTFGVVWLARRLLGAPMVVAPPGTQDSETFVETPGRADERSALIRSALLLWPWLFGCVVLAEGLVNVGTYVTSDSLPHAGQQHGLVKLAEWIAARYRNYDRVCIEPHGEQLDLYLAAYTGMTPQEFRDAPKSYMRIWAFDRCERLGPFYFMGRHDAVRQWNATGRKEKWLFVDSHGEFIVEFSDGSAGE